MKTFTVFVQESSGEGTIHIQAYKAKTMGEACDMALEQVAADWGGEESGFSPSDDSLHILGVAEGDVKILHWDDLNT